jgi:hypothetical protein
LRLIAELLGLPLVAAIMAVGQAAREPRAPMLDFSDMVLMV